MEYLFFYFLLQYRPEAIIAKSSIEDACQGSEYTFILGSELSLIILFHVAKNTLIRITKLQKTEVKA